MQTDNFSMYMAEIRAVDLLTAEEEQELARAIEAGRRAERALKENGVEGARREALEQTISEGKAAYEHLVAANTRLVVSIARRYQGHGVSLGDLVQEGNLGLMRAAGKYDYRRGTKFSTYATWWIRQTVHRAVATHGRAVRISAYTGDRGMKIRQARGRLVQELGREPTRDEIAVEVGLKGWQVADAMEADRITDAVPLDAPILKEDGGLVGDRVECDAPVPEEVTEASLLREAIEEVLELLSPREARILRLRFGLDDGCPRTLVEVGEMFGLTRERIRQIEAGALKRLRHPRYARLLKGFLN